MIYDKHYKFCFKNLKTLASITLIAFLVYIIIFACCWLFWLYPSWNKFSIFYKVLLIFPAIVFLIFFFLYTSNIKTFKKMYEKVCHARKKLSEEKEILYEGPACVHSKFKFQAQDNVIVEWLFLTKDSIECFSNQKNDIVASVPLNEITDIQKSKNKMLLGLSIITNTDTYIFLVAETVEVLNEWHESIINAMNASKNPENQSVSKAQSAPIPQKKEEPKAPCTDSFFGDFSTFG